MFTEASLCLSPCVSSSTIPTVTLHPAVLLDDELASVTQLADAKLAAEADWAAHLSSPPRHTTGILSATLWRPCSPHVMAPCGNKRREFKSSGLFVVAVSVKCELGSW